MRAAVLVEDSAGVVTEVTEGGRGVAVAVLAWVVVVGFHAGVEQFLGSGAGLSAATVTRLTTQWQDEAKAFEKT